VKFDAALLKLDLNAAQVIFIALSAFQEIEFLLSTVDAILNQ
jgi:hypothetical protein